MSAYLGMGFIYLRIMSRFPLFQLLRSTPTTNIGVLLIALRHLAQAQGIAKVAKAAGIERESLYRALSEHGNPRLSTLVAVTKAIGVRLTVEAAH